MIVHGYNFYGNRDQSQGSLIAEINQAFDPPIPEVGGGMCYMLSMQFLLDYLKERGDKTPEAVFDRITGDYVYLRQIAGNFREYIQHGFTHSSVENTTETYISELSRKRSEAKLVAAFDTGHLPNGRLDHPARGHLIVFYFKTEDGRETCGHAVAVVRDGTDYCLYDPNCGVYRTQNPDDIYGGVLPNLYNPQYVDGYLFSVSKVKLD